MAPFYHTAHRKVKEILASFPNVNKRTLTQKGSNRPQKRQVHALCTQPVLSVFQARFWDGKFYLRHFVQNQKSCGRSSLIFVVFCFIFLLTSPNGKSHLPTLRAVFLFLALSSPLLGRGISVQPQQIGGCFFYTCTFCTKHSFLTKCSFLEGVFPSNFVLRPFPTPFPSIRQALTLFPSPTYHFINSTRILSPPVATQSGAYFPPSIPSHPALFHSGSLLGRYPTVTSLFINRTAQAKRADRKPSNDFSKNQKKYSKRGLTK